ncbi:hypothetical protein AAFF_G00019630 [Aldrovandia affinis]|uniref:Uncharacterized protein n=1 Tax=Aldrovandia affinis TaxID=143900 RepID=A0AAD7WGM2_9TELE|nr:hypothetical protein AAFF_G00019630 [Aldrovandia affinis]
MGEDGRCCQGALPISERVTRENPGKDHREDSWGVAPENANQQPGYNKCPGNSLRPETLAPPSPILRANQRADCHRRPSPLPRDAPKKQ